MSGSPGGFEPWPDDIWETSARPAARSRRRRPERRLVVALVALAVVLVVSSVVAWSVLRSGDGGTAEPSRPAQSPRSAQPSTPKPATTRPAVDVEAARGQLLTLEVAEPVDDGTYDRAAFPHWIDLDGDGCSTECVVLKEQAVASGAANTTGWWSSYDGKFITSVHEMQIDHVVSLKEAWISGARLWNAATREVFANDLDGELLAVSGSSNKSKGARDVAKWQPRVRAAWCDLAARVVRTKAKWRLTVDAREKSKLDEMLSTCTGA